MEKKRHHFVPIAYLKRFADTDGYLMCHRKVDGFPIVRSKPSETGYRNYYYSQPTPDGGQDNNALEDMFSRFEAGWPRITDTLAARLPANHLLSELLGFIGFQRTRVPAFREAVERSMAQYVMGQLRHLEAAGRLDPPEDIPDILDKTEVLIDPHQSIHAIAQLLRDHGPILDRLGYCVVHNASPIGFLTSDNPVAYFERTRRDVVPYPVHPNDTFELLFPVSPTLLIRGDTKDRERFRRRGIKHVKLRDRREVEATNRILATFAYEVIFSTVKLPRAFLEKYGNHSPIVDPSFVGFDPDTITMPPMVFGPRSRLPKWKGSAGNG